MKLDNPEHDTTKADVAAATFGSKPAIYSRGTTKLPPPLPSNPANNPNIVPPISPKKIFCFSEKSPRFGFHPLSIKIAAAAVNNANIRISGLIGRLTFKRLPKGAKITMVVPNGIATRQSIKCCRAYVIVAELLLTKFNSIPRGMASSLKSIPSQNNIGI